MFHPVTLSLSPVDLAMVNSAPDSAPATSLVRRPHPTARLLSETPPPPHTHTPHSGLNTCRLLTGMYREPDGGDETDPYPGFALRNFSQKVDHFNFENGHAGTWDQRYLISTDAWDASKGG